MPEIVMVLNVDDENMSPNEVVHVYENQSALMRDLQSADSQLTDVIDKKVDDDADDETLMHLHAYSLRDGKGQPLTYPIQVVSMTAIVPKGEARVEFSKAPPNTPSDVSQVEVFVPRDLFLRYHLDRGTDSQSPDSSG